MNNKGFSVEIHNTANEVNNLLYNNRLYKGFNTVKSFVKKCLTKYQIVTNIQSNKDGYICITTLLQCSNGINCVIKDHTMENKEIKKIIKRQKQRLIKEIF